VSALSSPYTAADSCRSCRCQHMDSVTQHRADRARVCRAQLVVVSLTVRALSTRPPAPPCQRHTCRAWCSASTARRAPGARGADGGGMRYRRCRSPSP
jgi:hypothetical protein